MDPKGVKQPQEPMGIPSMMQQMMQTMCGTGELGPAALCRRMATAMGATTETGAQATTEAGDEACAQSDEDAARSGCCAASLRRDR